MKRDVYTNKFNSSFLSFEKDIETILRKLFIESNPYSEILKRLLVINTKDCLDNLESPAIKEKLKQMSLAKLRQEGYIKVEPKIAMSEHEEVKSYIIVSCDNFSPNNDNPYYRDCTVNFTIVCHLDCWDLGNYRIRPLKIAGFIDGILNEAKLSGIGTFNFVGCDEVVYNEDLAGYTLIYRAVHGNDDKIPRE